MTPVGLLKNFYDLYAYYFWKICQPVRLLQTTFIRAARVFQKPFVQVEYLIIMKNIAW